MRKKASGSLLAAAADAAALVTFTSNPARAGARAGSEMRPTSPHDTRISAWPAETNVHEQAPQSPDVQQFGGTALPSAVMVSFTGDAANGDLGSAQFHALAAAAQLDAASERGYALGGLVGGSADLIAQCNRDHEMASLLQLQFIHMDASWGTWRLRTHSLHARMADLLADWLPLRSHAVYQHELLGAAVEQLERACGCRSEPSPSPRVDALAAHRLQACAAPLRRRRRCAQR